MTGEHQQPSGAPGDERGDTHSLEGTHGNEDEWRRAPMATRHHTAMTTTRGSPHDHEDEWAAPHGHKDNQGAPTVTTMAGAPHDHKDEWGATAMRTTGDGHDDHQGAPHDHKDDQGGHHMTMRTRGATYSHNDDGGAQP